MATYGSSLVITEVTPNAGLKTIVVATPSIYAAAADTFVVDLTAYGIQASGLLSIIGVFHSGAYSMIGAPEPVWCTTSTSGICQIVAMSAGTGKRIYTIVGKSV